MPLYCGLGSAAVSLLVSRIERQHDPNYVLTKRDIQNHVLLSGAAPKDVHYVLHERDMVLAAAHAVHSKQGDITWISQLAVSEECEGQGLARLLTQYVAAKALQFGDTRLCLYALNPIVFEHIGFTSRAFGGQEMEAAPAAVLGGEALQRLAQLDSGLFEQPSHIC